MNAERRRLLFNAIIIPFLAVISGLLVAAVLILFTKTPPLEAFKIIVQEGFTCSDVNHCALFSTLERMTPLILTGLAAVVAFRSGMFQIGQEGQFLIGATVAAWLGYAVKLPPVIHPIFILLVSALVGACYGWIPGVLKVKLGVNALLSSIMLNAVAVLFIEYMVQFPMRADVSATAHSPIILDSAVLPSFFTATRWGWGFVIAIILAIAIYIYLWRTSPGYEQRMAGQSRAFALFGGIPSDSSAIRAMLISGALAGLAGGIEVLGVHHRIMTGFSVGLGFDGVSVAILGQIHPLGVVIVSFLIAGLRIGAQLGLQIQAHIPRELGGVIIGLIVLFVACRNMYVGWIDQGRKLINRFIHRKEKKAGI
jgi:ABC-type uncharacterized transport system permease subunit